MSLMIKLNFHWYIDLQDDDPFKDIIAMKIEAVDDNDKQNYMHHAQEFLEQNSEAELDFGNQSRRELIKTQMYQDNDSNSSSKLMIKQNDNSDSKGSSSIGLKSRQKSRKNIAKVQDDKNLDNTMTYQGNIEKSLIIK